MGSLSCTGVEVGNTGVEPTTRGVGTGTGTGFRVGSAGRSTGAGVGNTDLREGNVCVATGDDGALRYFGDGGTTT